jgi:hypothetical protein
MSGGYTPLFDSLTTGTLCGRWPDVGLWPIVLSLADRHGVVDVTPAYIASVTGLPIADVIACMKRFCEPDPYSRSNAEDGARLVLIEPQSRQWGWRIVNHGKYREKARKAAYDADRTASGADATRKREQRNEGRDVPTRPDASRAVPLSDKTRQDSDESKSAHKRATRLPESFTPDLEHARQQLPDIDAQAEAERFKDYWLAKSGAGAVKSDWPATWRNWIRNCVENKRYARIASEQSTANSGEPNGHAKSPAKQDPYLPTWHPGMEPP